MNNLPGYNFNKNLYQGTRTLVYSGQRSSDNKSVIIKVLRNSHPNFSELVQFRNQYIITRHLEHPAIVQPLVLERYGNGYALVMPDDGAIALTDYWQHSHHSQKDFLNIAIQLTKALHYLNQQRVIHKDIKPNNILIHPETKQVKLIDFSISSLLPTEQQQLINPNVLEGTLAYISPEQTGRMNRGIDYRSDFYSLGVTFFELLSGKLPFQSDDPMELVHCHIAQTAKFPVESELPEILQQIILKLMAKNAEDRYQSALGLKHDLEQCLQQLETIGKITSFELAHRDKSDRFIIPEKLYGRETEVQTLLDAFERVANSLRKESPPTPLQTKSEATSGFPHSTKSEATYGLPLSKGGGRGIKKGEMMLLAGFSGIGKTAVVNEVHKPIVRKRGYFIKGKFDQFNRNIPFYAFVQAFRDLMEQLLGESDTDIEIWKTKILEAVGENGQVIIDVIPELENIVGKQPSVPDLSGSAAQNRFNLLFNKFIQVFTTKEHPLVIFLDDLQWADLASLNLLKLLMNESEGEYLLMLGAYRDNEVFPTHPLMLTLDELLKNQAIINTITLQPLSFKHINQLISETLMCSEKLAQPLSKLVNQKTKGNPFFTTQFLKGLYEDQQIIFNQDLGYWECDLSQVRDAALTDDVVEFIAGRLQKLSEETQQVLKLASCIGNQFELEILAVVCEESQEEVATDIWRALQEGLIIPISEAYKFFQGDIKQTKAQMVTVGYRFLHDRVQQAAYSLIPEQEKQKTHLHIGRTLLNSIPEKEQTEYIFDIINQLNIGRTLIDETTEQNQFSQLNLIAGKKAKAATAYTAAFEYFLIGLELLGEDSWKNQYKLTLELHNLVTEAAYLNGNFEQMQKFIEIIRQNTQTLLDKILIYEINITACITQSKPLEAIEIALSILQQLGINFPEQPDASDIQQGINQVIENLKGISIPDLVHLPIMTDSEKIAAMKILMRTLPAVFQSYPVLAPLIAFEMVKISILHGNTSVSAYGYALYGLLMCGSFGDIDAGSEFGKLALSVLSNFNSQELKAKILTIFSAHIAHWQCHIRETLSPALEGYLVGIETGDLEYAGYCAYIYLAHSFWLGKDLINLEKDQDIYIDYFQIIKQKLALNWGFIYQQTLLNLQGKSAYLYRLIGTQYDEYKMLPLHQKDNDLYTISHLFINKLLLSYLFNNYELALDNAKIVEESLAGVTGLVIVPVFYFYDSLVRLALYPNLPAPEKQAIIDKIYTTNQEKMKMWVDHAPMNYLHKFNLVEAEICRVKEQKISAIELYDRAIAGAKENEYIQEEALANELAAKFYLDWSKEKIAASYMQEAYYCYARWGAKAKTEQLEEKYPQLLAPILQQQWMELNSLDSIEILTQTLTSKVNTQTSSGGFSDTLDFASILQTAQTLSSTIELDQLLAKIVKITLTNTGAQKTVLLSPQTDQWQLQAIAQLTKDGRVETDTHWQPLTTESNLPIRLIQYVKNTQSAVLIDEGKTEIVGILEGYLLQYQPQSVFCVPLLSKGNLVAILYLEHPTTKGVFTRDRQAVIQFFCAQAAIALKNARLYEQATQALRDLQQAHLQIVQSEKMSTLGNLMAGVAHEINNPLGFIVGNIQLAQENLTDLLDHLALYEKNASTEDLADHAEEIDLEYLREDFPNILESMNVGVERMKKISTSLRIFSRKDQECKSTFDIHDGIESTLTILKHRTKASEQRPKIQIIRDYEDLPEINCFPGQLNQVFMNILANAIDAFDEANEGKTYTEIEENPNRIVIRTSMVENQVKIKIEDNANGIKAEAKDRIFEYGFTTKDVGKGTGLGMAIAHQIITEKHGGTITCDSTLGKGTIFIISLPIS